LNSLPEGYGDEWGLSRLSRAQLYADSESSPFLVDILYALRGRKESIVREAGAKMPADIGGSIYGSLPDQKSTTVVETAVRRFVENQL
jgi:hypothetical protein